MSAALPAEINLPPFVMVGSKKISLRSCNAYCFDQISHAGWLKIESIGNENLWFVFKDDTGEERMGYCKCL
jgi:hypothetical protein